MNEDAWLEEIERKVQEKRKNYKGPHCCLTMHSELSYGLTLLDYNAKYREYGIKIPKSTNHMTIDYCMFCGREMPFSLRKEWVNILKKEYGLNDPVREDKKQIPQEFLTDEWWKKNYVEQIPTTRQQSIYSHSQKNQEIEETVREEYKGPHCCLAIHWEVSNKKSVLEYNAKYREYAVKIPNSSTYMLMDYCLFCGQMMPPSLRDEWFDILEQEYQLEDPMDDDRKKIPQEFLTDEWWRKRNL